MAVKILVNQTSLLQLKAPGGVGIRVEWKRILPVYIKFQCYFYTTLKHLFELTRIIPQTIDPKTVRSELADNYSIAHEGQLTFKNNATVLSKVPSWLTAKTVCGFIKIF